LLHLPLTGLQQRKTDFLHEQAMIETISAAEITKGLGADLQSLIDAGSEHYRFHVVTS
jgi:hypothetical protein